MFDRLRLDDRVALVTGAGRGIGKAIALGLAEAGADVIVAARTLVQVEETAQEIARLGKRVLPLPCNVTSTAQVEEMVKKALDRFGRIDILVNSAGVISMRPLVPLPDKSYLSEIVPGFDQGATDEEWERVVGTNFKGTFLVTRAVAPTLIAQRRGKVIMVSSTEAVEAWTYHSLYASSKAALSMFTRVLAKEWARYGINVNAIAPGFYRTAASEFGYRDERLKETQVRMIPLRRFGDLRDLGLLAVYLASPAGDYITGQTIFIDGGTSA